MRIHHISIGLFTILAACALALSVVLVPSFAFADDSASSGETGTVEETASTALDADAQNDSADDPDLTCEEAVASTNNTEQDDNLAEPAPSSTGDEAAVPTSADAASPATEPLGDPEASATTSSGPFEIVAADGYALSTSDGTTNAGTTLQFQERDSTSDQRFCLVSTEDGYSYLTTAVNTMALEAQGDRVVLAAYNESTIAQRWLVEEIGRDRGALQFRIATADGTLYFTAVGTGLILKAASGSASQAFTLLACSRVSADGPFVLETTLKSGLVLDVVSGAWDNGGLLQIYNANETNAQAWGLEYDASNGYYSLTSYNSGKVIDVPKASTAQGLRLNQHTSNNTDAQRWALEFTSGKTAITLFSAATGKAINVQGAKAEARATVAQSARIANTALEWILRATVPSVADGVVLIREGQTSSWNIDIPSASPNQGTASFLYTPNGSMAQRFSINKLDDGSYAIISAAAGMRLTAQSGGSIAQMPNTNGDNQRWIIMPDQHGHFTIRSASGWSYMGTSSTPGLTAQISLLDPWMQASGGWNTHPTTLIDTGVYVLHLGGNYNVVLDVDQASLQAGANIGLFYDTGNVCQKFWVINNGNNVEIYSVHSLYDLDVVNGIMSAGTNIRQWVNNASSAQRWVASLEDGGIVFRSAANNSLAMGTTANTAGANVALVNAGANGCFSGFILAPSGYSFGFNEQIALLDALGGQQLQIFHSRKGISDATWNWVTRAVNIYGEAGTDVGFIMLDLYSGAGISYNIDTYFYSASSVKGFYVTGLNYIYPQALYEKNYAMWNTINTSSNESYAELFSTYGYDPIEYMRNMTHAWDYEYYGYYAFYTARTFTKLWTGIADYLMGSYDNSDWARVAFSENEYISTRSALDMGGTRTVYGKSGWMPAGGVDSASHHNEGVLVMEDGHPFLICMLTTQSTDYYNYMVYLAQALDQAHRELVY